MTEDRNEARLRAVFEAAVDGIILIDDRGTIEQVNPAIERMFGFSASELLGQNVKVLMPSPYHEEHDGYLDRYRATSERHIIGIGREVVARHKSGRTFPMHLSVAEVLEGNERRFAGIIRDISAAKAAERAREELIARLEAQNAELERFTYTVSHDLKSPLITIKSFVGQLEKSVAKGNMERFRADVGRISAAAEKMKALLDNLLELSRIGRVANPSVDVDLRELVDEVLELLSAPIAERRAQIEVALSLPRVRGDRIRLREVVQNLVENALKFSADAPPRVEIGGRVEGELVVCHVRDHGVGIDPRYHERIFGLFEQLDAGSHKEGTGVGLALVRRIVNVHGGRTWAESEGPGKGLTIFFSLPLARPPAGTAAATSQGQPA
jgi:two-component system, LuxR family, sensor kinase FixL